MSKYGFYPPYVSPETGELLEDSVYISFGFMNKKKYAQYNYDFINYVVSKYGYNHIVFVYDMDYDGWKNFYKHKNLQTYTGIKGNSKYVKLGYAVSNISNSLELYQGGYKQYIHVIKKHPNAQTLAEMYVDYMEHPCLLPYYFINLNNGLLLLPHSDWGYGIRDLTGKNHSIVQDLFSFLRKYNIIIYPGLDVEKTKKYVEENSINIIFNDPYNRT